METAYGFELDFIIIAARHRQWPLLWVDIAGKKTQPARKRDSPKSGRLSRSVWIETESERGVPCVVSLSCSLVMVSLEQGIR